MIRFFVITFIWLLIYVNILNAKENNWVEFGSAAGEKKYYIDTNNIFRHAGLIRVWSIIDYKNKFENAFSAKYADDIDCNNDTSTNSFSAFYSRHMGEGEVVYTSKEHHSSPIVPGSLLDEAKQYVCLLGKEPKWQKITEIDDASFYIDVNNIEFDRKNSSVSYWHLADFSDENIKRNKRDSKSMNSYETINCATKKNTTKYLLIYQDHLASGNILRSGSLDKIHDIIPGSSLEFIYKYLCNSQN